MRCSSSTLISARASDAAEKCHAARHRWRFQCLLEQARKELDVARKLIAECGYHRRDGELAELDGVAAGRRVFADLPPRL